MDHSSPMVPQEFLETNEADVPDATRVEIVRACAMVADVRAAYATRSRLTLGGGGGLREGLHLAYHFDVSPSSADEVRHVSIALIRAMPAALCPTGFTVLSQAALPWWRRRSVRASSVPVPSRPLAWVALKSVTP